MFRTRSPGMTIWPTVLPPLVPPMLSKPWLTTVAPVKAFAKVPMTVGEVIVSVAPLAMVAVVLRVKVVVEAIEAMYEFAGTPVPVTFMPG